MSVSVFSCDDCDDFARSLLEESFSVFNLARPRARPRYRFLTSKALSPVRPPAFIAISRQANHSLPRRVSTRTGPSSCNGLINARLQRRRDDLGEAHHLYALAYFLHRGGGCDAGIDQGTEAFAEGNFCHKPGEYLSYLCQLAIGNCTVHFACHISTR